MPSRTIKKEKEDLEKPVNNLVTKLLAQIKIPLLVILLSIGLASSLQAQLGNFVKGRDYIVDSIIVSGLKTFNNQTLISYSGLRKGQKIALPGEKVSAIIQKLWSLNLFSDINLYVVNVEGQDITIEIEIEELPTLSAVKINGLKKGRRETIIDETELKVGKKLSESFMTNTKNYIENKFKKDGFLKTKVNLNMILDSLETNTYKLVVNVDRGKKMKINKIDFQNNEIFSNFKLRNQFKKTKQKKDFRFWKASKFIEEDYTNDLKLLIDFYKENGYRDARIVNDSLIQNGNKIVLSLQIDEGLKYYFGDIKFIGNTVYSNSQLEQILGIQTGETYNGVLLKKRIADTSKPDGQDITNLYQNNGYLFSSVTPVEVNADGNEIDLEIRINEGKPAYFNKISVVGNNKTNDHVIYREIRTRPGQPVSYTHLTLPTNREV